MGQAKQLKQTITKHPLLISLGGGQTFRANGVIVVPNNGNKWVSNVMNDDLERVENEYNIECRERNLLND